MLTVQDLLSGTPPVLRALDCPANSPSQHGTPVQDVLLCADPWAIRRPIRGVLVIASVRCYWTDEGTAAGPAEQWGRPEQWMPGLVEGGAAGLVMLAERGLGVPWRTLAGGAGGLPVLEPYGDCAAAELEALVLSRQREAVRLARRQTGELLDLSARLHHRGEGPELLLRWLEQQTGATVTVLDDLEEGWLELPVQSRLLGLMANRRAQAGVDGGNVENAAGPGPEPRPEFDPGSDEQYVMFHELGGEARHSVLAAARSTPLPRAGQELLAKAADQITMLSRSSVPGPAPGPRTGPSSSPGPSPRGRHRRPHDAVPAGARADGGTAALRP